MAGPLNATVILARCSKTKKLFGIRVEKREKQWYMTWAFPIDEEKAKHEGFNKNKVNLGGVDDNYPGCPYCGDEGFGQCGSCEKNGCLGCLGSSETKSKKSLYTCPWCGNTCEMEFSDSINASGGGY
jgi:hypothetical protein